MTASLTPPVRVFEPGDLIASIPHLLGFHPENSLVVLAMRRDSVTLTLRVDVPLSRHRRSLAAQLLIPLREHQPSAVVILVFGGGRAEPPEELPDSGLIDVMDEALASIDVPVAHAAWVERSGAGARWFCYDDVDCTGVVSDPTTTQLGAAMAAAGMVTFANREELAAVVAPEPDEVLERRSALLDKAIEEQHFATGAGIRLISAAVDAVPNRERPLSDDEVVQLTMALTDSRVRDACLRFVLGPEAPAAERLWLELTKGSPIPERAEPATLLAFSAYLRGDGGLASVAIQEAEAACPGHRLAVLLRSALDCGLAPARITELARGAAVESAWLLGADDQSSSGRSQG